MVLDLETWIAKSRKPAVQTAVEDRFTIGELQEFLNSFFLMGNAPAALMGESIIYNNVVKAVDELSLIRALYEMR